MCCSAHTLNQIMTFQHSVLTSLGEDLRPGLSAQTRELGNKGMRVCAYRHVCRLSTTDRQYVMPPRTSFLWQAHTRRPEDTSAHTHACSHIDIKHLLTLACEQSNHTFTDTHTLIHTHTHTSSGHILLLINTVSSTFPVVFKYAFD